MSESIIVIGRRECNDEHGMMYKETSLDLCLEALFEKRGSVREKGFTSIIEVFNKILPHYFVENNYVTLLQRCLSSIKKGPAKEVILASHMIGLLALTIGPGEKAQEILEESVPIIALALNSPFEKSKISSLIECLAVITFVGGERAEETEKSMKMLWQLAHPNLGLNVAAVKASPSVIKTMVSAWSLLLSTVDGWTLSQSLQESMLYLSTLLEKDDRSLRIAAGQALALIFEMEKLHEKNTFNGVVTRELKKKVLEQISDLSAEGGGKGCDKKYLGAQRTTFRDIKIYLEDGRTPEERLGNIGGNSVKPDTWAQLIQINFLKHFLGGGFQHHMQANEFLHDVFGLTPKVESILHDVFGLAPEVESIPEGLLIMTRGELQESEKGVFFSPNSLGKGWSKLRKEDQKVSRRMFFSPNSALSKGRSKMRKQERKLSRNDKRGHYAVDFADY